MQSNNPFFLPIIVYTISMWTIHGFVMIWNKKKLKEKNTLEKKIELKINEWKWVGKINKIERSKNLPWQIYLCLKEDEMKIPKPF